MPRLHDRGVPRVHTSDMTEPIAVADAAPDEVEASAIFEVFYRAEALTLFRRARDRARDWTRSWTCCATASSASTGPSG